MIHDRLKKEIESEFEEKELILTFLINHNLKVMYCDLYSINYELKSFLSYALDRVRQETLGEVRDGLLRVPAEQRTTRFINDIVSSYLREPDGDSGRSRDRSRRSRNLKNSSHEH